MRESGETIVYFAGKFTLDWLYVTRLQHHLKTKCKIPLKSTWSPKFSIFLGYLPRIWFNLINYTFHVFKVVKNSQYQKFYSSKIKIFRCYKRYLCEAGERAYSCPSPSALIAGGATGSCWLLRLLRGPAWHCEGRDMVNEGCQFVIVWASVQELTPKQGGLSSLHSCPLYTPGPTQPKPAN